MLELGKKSIWVRVQNWRKNSCPKYWVLNTCEVLRKQLEGKNVHIYRSKPSLNFHKFVTFLMTCFCRRHRWPWDGSLCGRTPSLWRRPDITWRGHWTGLKVSVHTVTFDNFYGRSRRFVATNYQFVEVFLTKILEFFLNSLSHWVFWGDAIKECYRFVEILGKSCLELLTFRRFISHEFIFPVR